VGSPVNDLANLGVLVAIIVLVAAIAIAMDQLDS